MSDEQTRSTCSKCNAEVLDTFSYRCGSIRPNYVTPSFAQSDKCKIRVLEADYAALAAKYDRLVEKCLYQSDINGRWFLKTKADFALENYPDRPAAVKALEEKS